MIDGLSIVTTACVSIQHAFQKISCTLKTLGMRADVCCVFAVHVCVVMVMCCGV